MQGTEADLYIRLGQYLQRYRKGQATGDDGLLSLVKLDVRNRPEVHRSLVVVQECLATIEASGQTYLNSASMVMPMVIDLAKTAIGIPQITFDHIRTAVGLNKVLEALASPSPILIDIALDCIQKATRPSDASLLGGQVGLIDQIVRIWLQTPDTGLSERALDILLALLKLDAILDHQDYRGSGLVWRRIFAEPRLYEELFLSTSDFQSERPSEHSRFVFRFNEPASRSVRQGRLLTFVLRVAKLRYDSVALSNHFDVEASFQRKKRALQGSSLLDYVTRDMCDENDDLVDLIRLQFLKSLLEIRDPLGAVAKGRRAGYSSPTLDYLERSHLHDIIVNRYSQQSPSSVEGSLLRDCYVQYLSTYFFVYPDHACAMEKDRSIQILSVIADRLDVPKRYWAPMEGRAPKDVAILQEIPLPMLFEGPGRRAYQLIPANPANSSALKALANIFHGSQINAFERGFGNDDDRVSGFRPAVSRLLFFMYLRGHPTFWADLAAAINVITNPDATKQAIDLARSIATANWQELPEDRVSGNWQIPSENEMKDTLSFRTGLATLLMTGSQAWRALLTPVAMPKMNTTADASTVHWSVFITKLDALEDIMKTMMEARTAQMETDPAVWASAQELLSRMVKDWKARRSVVNPEIQTMEY